MAAGGILQLTQAPAGAGDDPRWHSGQGGDRQPVALVGRAFQQGMQEDDRGAMLHRVQVDIGDAGILVR